MSSGDVDFGEALLAALVASADRGDLRALPSASDFRLPLVVVEALLAEEGEAAVLAVEGPVSGAAAGGLAAGAGLRADVQTLVVEALAAEVAGVGGAEVGGEAGDDGEVAVIEIEVEGPGGGLPLEDPLLAALLRPDLEGVVGEEGLLHRPPLVGTAAALMKSQTRSLHQGVSFFFLQRPSFPHVRVLLLGLGGILAVQLGDGGDDGAREALVILVLDLHEAAAGPLFFLNHSSQSALTWPGLPSSRQPDPSELDVEVLVEVELRLRLLDFLNRPDDFLRAELLPGGEPDVDGAVQGWVVDDYSPTRS